MARAVRSEMVKFRTLRSHLWLLGVAVGFVLVLGPVQALGAVLAESEEPVTDSGAAAATALNGTTTAMLLLGILGVLVVAGEYAPRAIRTTFMTIPRRGVVVAAKAAALGALTAVACAAAVASAVTVSMLVLARGEVQVTWSSPHVLRVSVLMVWHLVGWAVLGLVAGWVTRSKIGGAALLMTVMLVLTPMLGLIPGRVGEVIVALMPSSAGAAMTSTQPAAVDLAGIPVSAPTFGFVLWTAYLVLFSAAAAVAVARRDV